MTLVISSAVSANKLFQTTPDLVTQAVIDALFSYRSISGNLMQSHLNGVSKQADTYFRYGRDHFVNGLPKPRITFTHGGAEGYSASVTAILDAIEGEPILIDLLQLDFPDYNIVALEWLQNSADYIVDRNDDNNNYSVTKVSTGEIGHFWAEDTTFIGNTLTIRLNPTLAFPNYTEDVVADVSPMLPTTLLFQVRYHLTSTDAAPDHEYRFWSYDPSLGTYPALAIDSSIVGSDLFYPVAPIIVEGDFVTNTYPEVAASTKKLLAKLDIDSYELETSMIDPSDPDSIANIESAFIMLAVDVNSNVDIALRYLYEHFRREHYSSGASHQDYLDWVSAGSSSFPPQHSIVVSDAGRVRTLMAVDWNFITIREVTGNVGDPQSLPDLTTLIPEGPELDTNNSGIGGITKQIVVGTTVNDYYNTHYIIYRKQYTPTTFIELVIHGLRHSSYVYPSGTVLRVLDDISDGGMFIPISLQAVKRFNGRDQSLIYYEALQLIIHAVEISHLAWYENPNFLGAISKFILLVTALIGIANVGAMIAKGLTALSIATTIVVNLITVAAVQEAFILLAEAIGGDLALVLAAVVAVVSLAYGKGELLLDLLDAEQLMKAATLMISAVNEVTKDEFLELQSDIEEFTKSAEELEEELEAANDLLDNGTEINLYSIISRQPHVDFNETPEQYFNRTIHETNPGVKSLDNISNYVDIALLLPQVR